ncbi:pyridoxal phosphate phosphatase PHOSPHO2, putative, partial [Ixodes scapularis]
CACFWCNRSCENCRCSAFQTKGMKKHLVVFDFDHTIIDANSDLYIRKLAPNGELPSEIKERYSPKGWTPFMRAVFHFLYDCQVQPDDILDCLLEINFVDGIIDLLKQLHKAGGYEVIIISDSNSVFIEHIMQVISVSYRQHVNVESGRGGTICVGIILVRFRHRRISVNLCKGAIMEEFLDRRRRQGVDFDHVSYVGDGNNDLCPCLRLRTSDLVFPRLDYPLAKLLNKDPGRVKAKVSPWRSGLDIADVLLNDGVAAPAAT